MPYLSLTSVCDFGGQIATALAVLSALLKAVVKPQHPPGNIMHIKGKS